MKKILCLLLAVLLLTGCQRPAVETTQVPTQAQIPESTPGVTVPDVDQAKPQDGKLTFANPGKVRITYTGNASNIRYITSVDQLPDEEALAGYDEAFFENHALLIVVDTVSSGSVRLELEEIRVEGKNAIVSLKRTMEGEIGTSDMATWMLWAEVEQGLDYTWQIKDREQIPAGEKY